jgi:hypothetical protein
MKIEFRNAKNWKAEEVKLANLSGNDQGVVKIVEIGVAIVWVVTNVWQAGGIQSTGSARRYVATSENIAYAMFILHTCIFLTI